MNINQVNSISRAVAQQEIERTVVNPFMLRQEADVTNSSNSVPVVVDDLVVPVDADSTYIICFYLLIQSATLTAAPVFTVNGPAGASVVTNESIPAIDTIDTDFLATIEVLVNNGSTSGDITIEFVSSVDTELVRVMAGSVVRSDKYIVIEYPAEEV